MSVQNIVKELEKAIENSKTNIEVKESGSVAKVYDTVLHLYTALRMCRAWKCLNLNQEQRV